jgi:hypothetical protein
MCHDIDGDEIADGIAGRTIEGVAVREGTSMAVGHLAAVAALAPSHKDLDVHQLRAALIESAEDMGQTGFDSGYGHGVVDPKRTLEWEPKPRSSEPMLDFSGVGLLETDLANRVGLQFRTREAAAISCTVNGKTYKQPSGMRHLIVVDMGADEEVEISCHETDSDVLAGATLELVLHTAEITEPTRDEVGQVCMAFEVGMLCYVTPIDMPSGSDADGPDEMLPDMVYCAELDEAGCYESDRCVVDLITRTLLYECRPAENECEQGFIQAKGEKTCDSGCGFIPASCYCPPDVTCVCGGGPPSACKSGPPKATFTMPFIRR